MSRAGRNRLARMLPAYPIDAVQPTLRESAARAAGSSVG